MTAALRYFARAGRNVTQKEASVRFDVLPTTVRNWLNDGITLGLWTEDNIDRWFAFGKKRRDKRETEPPVRPNASWRHKEIGEAAGDDRPIRFDVL